MCRHTGLLVCFACLFLSAHSSSNIEERSKREEACSTTKLFESHSSNGSLSMEGLDKILKSVRILCSSHWKEKELSRIHAVLEDASGKDDAENLAPQTKGSTKNAWLYAGVSVLFISTCGLAAVAVIKILPQWLFQPAIQYLVALAVGSLTGDAILHLIPHAFTAHEVHRHAESHNNATSHVHDDHSESHQEPHVEHGHNSLVIWRGVVVLAVLVVFFIVERLLNIFGEWRQRLQSTKQVDKVVHLLSGSSKMVGEKLCRHHRHSHQGHKNHQHQDSAMGTREGDQHLLEPRTSDTTQGEPDADLLVSCVKEVTFLNNGEEDCTDKVAAEDCSQQKDKQNGCSEWQGLVVGKPLIYCASHEICDGSDATTSAPENQRLPESFQSEHLVSVKPKGSNGSLAGPVEEISSNRQSDSLTVFISEHHTSHHGHSHSHGHIHARPHGVASLAWLVLAGDGMHNLSDGLAIGAAFAASITGGFTTAIAVLCHELPHELGDFAVLLKAGMTIKQAMICNLISSFLCLLGVLVGLAIGSAHNTAPWIFAATGGMFLYIALVDMMPELNGHSGKHRSAFLQLLLQLFGLLSGFAIMLTIALYEHDLSEMLQSFL